MRKFIIRNFFLYERVNANAYIFIGAFLFLIGAINLLLAGLQYLDIVDVFIVAGVILLGYGEFFVKRIKYKAFRCGKFLTGTLILLGITQIFNDQTFTLWTYCLLTLFIVQAFISFAYFKLYPPTWDEMDDQQRFDNWNGNTSQLFPEQQEQWHEIAKKYQ